MLGNKSLLERRINIRASDYRFADKTKYYVGFQTTKGQKEGTKIFELRNLAETLTDYTEKNIVDRSQQILDGFIEYLKSNSLIKSSSN